MCLQVGNPSRSECSSIMTLLRAKIVLLAGWHSTSHSTPNSSPEYGSVQAGSALQVCVVRWCMCPCRDETVGRKIPAAVPSLPLHRVGRALLQPQPGQSPGLQSNAPMPLALLHKGVGYRISCSRYRNTELLLRAGTESLLQNVIWFK